MWFYFVGVIIEIAEGRTYSVKVSGFFPFVQPTSWGNIEKGAKPPLFLCLV